MKTFTSKTQKIGEIGEELVIKLLKERKWEVLERNFTRKWGEIDIVAKNKGKIHFIEVKTISDDGLVRFSRETSSSVTEDRVSRENRHTAFRAEDNVHPWKLKRMAKTVETYLAIKDISEDFQADLYVVHLDLKDKKSKVRIMENIM